jgi:hypothetical protein
VSIWGLIKGDDANHTKVSISLEKQDFLPFLDMKMYWNDKDELALIDNEDRAQWEGNQSVNGSTGSKHDQGLE